MNQKGFSLMEVVISLAIISIIIIPFTQIFISSTKTNNLSKREIQATFLAQKYMEKAKEEAQFFPISDKEENGILVNENHELGFRIVTEYEDVTENIGKEGSKIKEGSMDFKNEDFNISISIEYGQTTSLMLNDNIGVIDNPNDILLELKNHGENSEQINVMLERLPFIMNTYNFNDKTIVKVFVTGVGEGKANMSVINKTNRNLIIYETNDHNNNLSFDLKEGNAIIVNNIDSNTNIEEQNEEKLYEVRVLVYFENRLYEKIISQVRN